MTLDLRERLRLSSERNLLLTLQQHGDHAELLRWRVRGRWQLLMPCAMLLSLILLAVWAILFHPTSWANRVAGIGLLPWMLPGWLAASAVLMFPHMACLAFSPLAPWRRTSIGMAATGLGMSAFGFGAMAFVGARFDAPQATSYWTLIAIWCVAGMLMLTASVNHEQNVRRAWEGNMPCE